MTDLSGQIALVTGASRGFGFASALAMGQAGAQVVALARTTGGLEELDEAIRAAGGLPALLVPLDITDHAGLGRLGAGLHERYGRVDLWLHTALFAAPLAPAAHIAPKDFDKALAINVTAFQRLIHVMDPLLRLAPAPLALIAAEDRAGHKFFGSHGAMKAAQSALTRSWAAETLPPLRVAEVVPPPMATAMRGRFFPGESTAALASKEDAAARLVAALPGLANGAHLAL